MSKYNWCEMKVTENVQHFKTRRIWQAFNYRCNDLKDIEWLTSVHACIKSNEYHCSKVRIINVYDLTRSKK